MKAIEQREIDSMRVLGLKEVLTRTGYKRRTVMRALADDAKDKSPGRRFPAPMKVREGSNRLEWREIKLQEWFDQREQAE